MTMGRIHSPRSIDFLAECIKYVNARSFHATLDGSNNIKEIERERASSETKM